MRHLKRFVGSVLLAGVLAAGGVAFGSAPAQARMCYTEAAEPGICKY